MICLNPSCCVACPGGVCLISTRDLRCRRSMMDFFVHFARQFLDGRRNANTENLSYGILLEGSMDMLLDSGELQHMKRGDVAVQRATQHQWINPSKTEWARMMFVLQDCKAVDVGGQTLKEDLGVGAGLIQASGNDS